MLYAYGDCHSLVPLLVLYGHITSKDYWTIPKDDVHLVVQTLHPCSAVHQDNNRLIHIARLVILRRRKGSCGLHSYQIWRLLSHFGVFWKNELGNILLHQHHTVTWPLFSKRKGSKSLWPLYLYLSFLRQIDAVLAATCTNAIHHTNKLLWYETRCFSFIV